MRMTKKIISIFNRLEDIALVLMFLAMVLIIFVQVIMRYVFNDSLSWSEELGKFLFVWLSWFGISIGARRNEHIRITMFLNKLSFRATKVAAIAAELVVIGICAVTFYYGVSLVIGQAGVRYAGIKISMSWGYLSVVVGCGLMILRSVVGIVDSAIAIKDGEPAAAALEGGNQ